METKIISTTQSKVNDETIKVVLTKQKHLISKEKERSIFNVSIINIEQNIELNRDWETFPEAHRDYINTIESFLY